MTRLKIIQRTFGAIIGITLCLLTVNVLAEDEAGNSDKTLEIFSPDKVLTDSTQPNYVNSYLDVKNHPQKSPIDFYLGLNFGLALDYFDYSLHGQGQPYSDSFDVAGAFGKVTVGIGELFSNDELYFGLAGDGSYDTSKYSGTIANDGFSVKMPYSFGLYMVPGIALTKNAILYAKIGGALSDFEVSFDHPPYDSFDKILPAFRAGLGVQTFLNHAFSVNFEYMFSLYADAKSNFYYHSENYEHKFSPLTNQISIGIAYHF